MGKLVTHNMATTVMYEKKILRIPRTEMLQLKLMRKEVIVYKLIVREMPLINK